LFVLAASYRCTGRPAQPRRRTLGASKTAVLSFDIHGLHQRKSLNIFSMIGVLL